MARLQSEIYKTLLSNYKPTIGKGMREETKYEQKISRDEINKEYYRQRETADNRVVDIAKSQGRLLEIIGLIEFLVDDTEKLNKYLDAIEDNNHAFQGDIEKNIIEKAIKKFDEELKEIPPEKRKNKTEIDSDTINELKDSLMTGIEEEIESSINKYIREPIDILLRYMQEIINDRKNEPSQDWRVSAYSP